ncbi:MAG: DUF4387 domain-containing protein [Acetomicrobium sp.]|jgi:hypothetical protein|uniref:DUF4387 domain-containing protein n=1 Tax=Acetomicrobium hydrogeniformans ATCC BAA-1850 TaxID=592015 RepID=A0A0T5X7L6_9BACT|nr:DUF4387 domain-containing protein [Acetomicrobium hydrogeniformans]KRT34460.1 hypothetical protein HMPREF1705_02812 [Acetomicrobium hydrogeniformans ATCC BAA-1850]MBC7323557.1 DUF4387 domain-containing protein [Acetomicrobium sp.]
MKTKNVCDLARTVRSKNAGSFMITLEIIFDDRQVYEKVKKSGAITREAIAKAYNVEPEKILDFMFFDPGMGIKANYQRPIPSGGPAETDVYGCQQYAPLFSLEIPWED